MLVVLHFSVLYAGISFLCLKFHTSCFYQVKKRNSEESSTQWTTGIAEVQLPIEYVGFSLSLSLFYESL